MKYLKTIIILFLSSFVISFTTESQNKLKTGFYYLAEKENEGEIIIDADSEGKYSVDRQEILTIGDFSAIKFRTRNFQPKPIKVIELKLTKNGRKKWAEIQNRMSKTGESLLFICNDKVYFEKIIIGKSSLENSVIDLYIESKYQENILGIIKSEMSDSR